VGVLMAAPSMKSLTSVNPSAAQQGQTLDVAVSGTSTSFVQGMTRANFGPGIAVNNVRVSNNTNASVNITVQTNAAVGTRSVSLVTGTEVATLVNAFTVSARPTLTLVSPNSGSQGQTGLQLVITGANTHFDNTSVVTFCSG